MREFSNFYEMNACEELVETLKNKEYEYVMVEGKKAIVTLTDKPVKRGDIIKNFVSDLINYYTIENIDDKNLEMLYGEIGMEIEEIFCHHNIVNFYSIFTDEGDYYTKLKIVDGMECTYYYHKDFSPFTEDDFNRIIKN